MKRIKRRLIIFATMLGLVGLYALIAFLIIGCIANFILLSGGSAYWLIAAIPTWVISGISLLVGACFMAYAIVKHLVQQATSIAKHLRLIE